LYLINTPKRMCIVLVTSTEIDMLSHLDTLSVIDHDLKELDEWSKKWLMTFNSDKTEIILYILTFEEHSGVCKYITIYFQHVYSI
jgi:hypothetical protein